MSIFLDEEINQSFRVLDSLVNELKSIPADVEGDLGIQSPADTHKTLATSFLSLLLRRNITSTMAKPEDVGDLDMKINTLSREIAAARRNITTCSEDVPSSADQLESLSHLLKKHYEISNDILALDEAIGNARRAANLTPVGHQNKPHRLEGLYYLLGERIIERRSVTDIDEAIQIAKQIAELPAATNNETVRRYSELGFSLGQKGLITGKLPDIDAGIDEMRKAIGMMASDYPERNRVLLRYATLLDSKGQLIKNALERKFCEKAAKALANTVLADMSQSYVPTSNDIFLEAIALFKAGFNICRSDPQANNEEFDNGIQLIVHSIWKTPDRDRQLGNRINFLGACIRNRFWYKSKANLDLKKALFCFAFVLYLPIFFISERVLAGSHFHQLCDDPQQNYEVSRVMISLIPRLTILSMNNAEKQRALSDLATIPSRLAAAAIKAGKRPYFAAAFLEQGRNLLATSSMEMGIKYSNLQRADPRLAEEFRLVRAELATPVAINSNLLHHWPETWQSLSNGTLQMEAKYNSLLDRIRLISGFEKFLKRISEPEMLSAASSGPIVIINASIGYDCFAVLVEVDQIRILDLPALNEIISEKMRRKGPGSIEALEWLWDIVANPVLTSLGFTKRPDNGEWPHIWWIPTGYMTLFPLHAAGYHRRHSSETVLDRVMSSYSSSVESIIQARQMRSPDPSLPIQALLVAMENTPGVSKLNFAKKEISILKALMKSSSIVPIEPSRQKQDVLANLPNCQIFHFAGHGETDGDDPLKSSLLLEDWKDDRLTVNDLLEVTLQDPALFLAYLSACGTGRMDDTRFTDQSVHLIRAHQLIGFRHVIGTLWEVRDELCVEVARLVYEEITAGGMSDESVSRGLHAATRKLRDNWLGVRTGIDMGRSWSNPQRSSDASGSDSTGESAMVLSRDILLCDEEEVAPSWVPYIHFGV